MTPIFLGGKEEVVIVKFLGKLIFLKEKSYKAIFVMMMY